MKVINLKDAAFELLKEIDVRVRAGGVDVIGLPTGFYKLDEALGGFRRKGHYFIGGRTGMGKSALALSMTANIAANKLPVLYVSLEMSASLLALRMLSGQSAVPSTSIERGLLREDEYARVKDAMDVFGDREFYIIDTATDTLTVANIMRKMREKNALEFATFDYISLFTDQGDNEVQRLEGIVGKGTALASELDIPILSLGQLNRGNNDDGEYPTLKNFRYSDRIGQDAFGVMLVHRPKYYDRQAEPLDVEDDAIIILDKNRQGPTGHLSARFYPKLMKWEQIKPTPVDPPPTGVVPTEGKTLKQRVQEGR